MANTLLRVNCGILIAFCTVLVAASLRVINPAWAGPIEDLIFKGGFEILVGNKAPTADAGTDQVVYGGGLTPVLLLGERSADVDGEIVLAEWSQLLGPEVAEGIQSGTNLEYFPPAVGAPTALAFELNVIDDDGAFDSDIVNVTVMPAQITATITLESGEPDPPLPTLYLFNAAGALLGSDSGNGVSIEHTLGAGVVYAVATADSQVDLALTVTGPDGLDLASSINTLTLGQRAQPFLTTADFADNPARLLVFGHAHDAGEIAPVINSEHPQIIEVALPHPNPGLRDPDRFLAFLNHTSIRFQEDAASAEAYYRAVDPDNERTTLDDFIERTGDLIVSEAHAIYQNDADLGFGRDMRARTNESGGVSSWVRNFPSLDHVVANEGLIATVAMEWGPPESGVGDFYTKFFVFGPDGERLLAADLDGRGAKFVPGLCNVCHGGAPKTTFLDETGVVIYPDNGDTHAQFLPWDLDTFNYSEQAGLTRLEQEQDFYDLNQTVKATYPSEPVIGNNWTGEVVVDLVDGWYSEGETFNGEYVPDDWKDSAETEALYLEVVGPNCRACHVQRGTSQQNAIDFSSYDKFMGYMPLLKEMIYDQGVMPLALRTYGHFWNGGSNSPAAKLAAMMPAEYDLLLPGGDVRKPGRPLARTGIATDLPPILTVMENDSLGSVLDGRDSLFSENQDWQVVSSSFTPEEVTAVGDQAITQRADGDAGASYSLVRQIIDPAAVKRTQLTRSDLGQTNYVINIAPLLVPCVGCHSVNGDPNIPVQFDHPDILDNYRAVLDRINFEYPSQSLMVTKPGGLRHGFNGDKAGVFQDPVTNWDYFAGTDGGILPFPGRGSAAQTITNWIQAGAPFWGNFSSGKSWTCQNVGQDIPDNDSAGLTDLVLAGSPQINAQIMIELQLEHTFLNDLEITLTNLDTGLASILVDRPLGDDGTSCDRQEIHAHIWDIPSGDSTDLCDSTAPFLVSVKPQTPMAVFDGSLLSGNWQLEVKDLSAGETGTLQRWCVRNMRLPD